MSATGLEVFDRTLQTTNSWLEEIMLRLGWSDRHKAWHALSAVLHTLRDRLPVGAAAHLSAQLPLLVRGVFFEGWQPAKTPVPERTADEFLVHITEAFLFDTTAEPRQILKAVIGVLGKHISPGEFEKVLSVLPKSIRELLS